MTVKTRMPEDDGVKSPYPTVETMGVTGFGVTGFGVTGWSRQSVSRNRSMRAAREGSALWGGGSVPRGSTGDDAHVERVDEGESLLAALCVCVVIVLERRERCIRFAGLRFVGHEDGDADGDIDDDGEEDEQARQQGALRGGGEGHPGRPGRESRGARHIQLQIIVTEKPSYSARWDEKKNGHLGALRPAN